MTIFTFARLKEGSTNRLAPYKNHSKLYNFRLIKKWKEIKPGAGNIGIQGGKIKLPFWLKVGIELLVI